MKDFLKNLWHGRGEDSRLIVVSNAERMVEKDVRTYYGTNRTYVRIKPIAGALVPMEFANSLNRGKDIHG